MRPNYKEVMALPPDIRKGFGAPYLGLVEQINNLNTRLAVKNVNEIIDFFESYDYKKENKSYILKSLYLVIEVLKEGKEILKKIKSTDSWEGQYKTQLLATIGWFRYMRKRISSDYYNERIKRPIEKIKSLKRRDIDEMFKSFIYSI